MTLQLLKSRYQSVVVGSGQTLFSVKEMRLFFLSRLKILTLITEDNSGIYLLAICLFDLYVYMQRGREIIYSISGDIFRISEIYPVLNGTETTQCRLNIFNSRIARGQRFLIIAANCSTRK